MKLLSALIPLGLCLAHLPPANAAIVQTFGLDYVAFEAELGTLTNNPGDETKYEILSPSATVIGTVNNTAFGDLLYSNLDTGGSAANYQSASPGATASYTITFNEAGIYTVYLRAKTTDYLTPAHPAAPLPSPLSLSIHYSSAFDGNPNVHQNPYSPGNLSDTNFTWNHLYGTSLTVGVGDTKTLALGSGTAGYAIDRIAFVKSTVPQALINDSYFTVVAIPEPQALGMSLLAVFFLTRRHRRAIS